MKVTQVQFKNIEQAGIKGSRIASRSYLEQFKLICVWKLNREPSCKRAVMFSMGAESELCKKRSNTPFLWWPFF